MAQQVTRIPKGFHHLESAVSTKFSRYPKGAPAPPKAYVKPKDRIARWNIIPGDRVRLMVGKPKEKWVDEKEGAAGGWNVYTVHSVDMTRNRVYLNGLTNKKSNVVQPVPANIDELPEEEKKQYLEQKNHVDTRRPVQYSNVQLCIEDRGPDSVFATRVATSAPWYNVASRRWQWTRFAAQTSVESSLPRDGERDQVLIPWPKTEKRKVTEATTIDTAERDVTEPTLALGPSYTIPQSVIPNSMRAPPTKASEWADEYVFYPTSRPNPRLQAAMPMYLGEELSPRFARFKKAKGWKARREMEASDRDALVKAAVDKWEAQGRDKGLEDILGHDLIGLEGVTIRPRTRKEIRESTGALYDQDLAEHKREVTAAKAKGMVFDYHLEEFVDGPKGIAAALKRERKVKRAARKLESLKHLTLEDDKNQVVPEDVRAH